MITRAIHHLALVTEQARLCEAGPGDEAAVLANLPRLAQQLATAGLKARRQYTCMNCWGVFWTVQEKERVQ